MPDGVTTAGGFGQINKPIEFGTVTQGGSITIPMTNGGSITVANAPKNGKVVGIPGEGVVQLQQTDGTLWNSTYNMKWEMKDGKLVGVWR